MYNYTLFIIATIFLGITINHITSNITNLQKPEQHLTAYCISQGRNSRLIHKVKRKTLKICLFYHILRLISETHTTETPANHREHHVFKIFKEKISYWEIRFRRSFQSPRPQEAQPCVGGWGQYGGGGFDSSPGFWSTGISGKWWIIGWIGNQKHNMFNVRLCSVTL